MRGMILVGLTAGAALGACGRDACDEAAKVPARLALGQGQLDYQPLSPGDVVASEYGPQGGSHLWLGLRVQGLVPGARRLLGDRDAPTVQLSLTSLADDQVWASSFSNWRAFEGDEEQSELVGAQLMLPFDVDTVLHAPFVLWAQVEDVCGTAVEAEVEIEVGDPGAWRGASPR